MPEKTVLLTGCTDGGLGAAMAQAYHAQGFKVIATLRDKRKAGTLADMESVDVLSLEVTSEESIRKCAKEVEKLTGGSLNVLVNNAGISGVMPLLDVSIEQAKKMYDVNVWGVLAMVQAFAPMLIKTKGVICNISSVSGELPMAWTGIYCSAKAATTKMSEVLRLEMAPLGVRVVTVILGGVSTNGNDPDLQKELEMPKDSYYQNIWSIINRHAKGEYLGDRANLDDSARKIVSDIVNSHRDFIRYGNGSIVSYWCNALLPHGLVAKLINANAGFDQLGAK